MKADYEQLLPANNRLFASERFDRDLVRDFLFLFSRAEFALKAAGLVRPGAYEEPNVEWKRFARGLSGRLLSAPDDEVAEAESYLTDHPPDREVLEDQVLRWRRRRQRADQTREDFLIESVKTVRNNLFHGGKELRTPLAERDRRLVKSALLVAAFAISLDGNVTKAFLDAGPDRAVA